MIQISDSKILDTNLSTEVLLKYYQIESKLKFNTESYVTKPSHQVIVRCVQWASYQATPVKDVADLATLLENGKYQNCPISELICHLVYLRTFKIAFKLIKRPNQRDFVHLLVTSGTILSDYITAKNFRDHKDYLNMMFSIKAKLTMLEMFDLRQIDRYWKYHHARLNQHHVFTAYFH